MMCDIIVDDFQIIGIFTDVEDPRVLGGRRTILPTAAIWDFVSSPVWFLRLLYWNGKKCSLRHSQ